MDITVSMSLTSITDLFYAELPHIELPSSYDVRVPYIHLPLISAINKNTDLPVCGSPSYDVINESIVVKGVTYYRHVIYDEDIFLQALQGNMTTLQLHLYSPTPMYNIYLEIHPCEDV